MFLAYFPITSSPSFPTEISYTLHILLNLLFETCDNCQAFIAGFRQVRVDGNTSRLEEEDVLAVGYEVLSILLNRSELHKRRPYYLQRRVTCQAVRFLTSVTESSGHPRANLITFYTKLEGQNVPKGPVGNTSHNEIYSQ